MVTPLLCKINFDTRVFLKLWRDVNEKFGTMRQKISEVETWYLLLCMKLFDYPKFSETMKGCSRFFGTLRREIFDRKTWCPLLCKIISDTTIFLTHCRDAHENIRYWETKFFKRNMWYAPFFIRKQSSESKNFLKKCRTPSQKFFGTVRQTFSGGKLWHPFYAYFFDTRIFLKHWRNAHENFRHCETENFWRKNVITRIMHKIFRYPKFFSTLKGFPRKLLALWDKKFSREKRDTTIMRKFSRYHIFSETLQGCSQNFSALWDLKVFDGETWYLSFHAEKFFETRNFLKNSSIPLQNFSALWDKQFSTENGETPLCINIFDTRIFLKLWRDVNEIFGTMRQKISEEKRDTYYYAWNFSITLNFLKQWRDVLVFWALSDVKFSTKKRDAPYYAKIFPIPQFFWHIAGMLTKIFGTKRPNFSTEICDTPPFSCVNSFLNQKLSEKQ